MDRVVRVLVVDDSAYVRKVVKEMLSRSPFLEVVGVARDGDEALEMVERLKPDVVTCDLIMPGTDGVDFIRKQMAIRPVPIVVVSIAAESSERVLSALDAGAVDFVQKPTALATEKVFEIAEDLVAKVKAAAGAPVGRLRDRPRPPPAPPIARRSGTAMIAGHRRLHRRAAGPQVGDPAAARRFSGAGRDCPAHADRLYRDVRQAPRRDLGADRDRSARRRRACVPASCSSPRPAGI